MNLLERPVADVLARMQLQYEVEAFLYRDAELLDGWRMDEWLTLLDPDIRYIVPTTDCIDGDPDRDNMYIYDNLFLLSERADQFRSGTAHAESPPSLTRRLVSNVVIRASSDDTIVVTANFLIHRSKREKADLYAGHYEHVLLRHDSGFRFRQRKAVLSHTSIQRHGKISIIL